MRTAAVLLLALAAQTVVASSMPEVDRYLAGKMRDHLVPGLAVVVIRDGAVIHERGFGELQPQSPVIIGSLSKAFTATAVLQLFDEKKLLLDAPMHQYLPDVHFSDPAMQRVTVRHLLHQTSGVPVDAPRAKGDDPTLAAHVAALADIRLVATPGQQHIYSSPNYQLLGRIVEVVSGQPFDAYVARRILQPLGMTSSGADAGAAARVTPGHNIWWGVAGPSSYRWESGRVPTASIITTAGDLSKFVLSHLGVGAQLLKPESLALSHLGVGKAEGFSYAMGWRDGTTRGLPSLWHGGALPSYRGAIVMLPQSRSAVVLLTNSSTIFADHTREMAAGVVAIMEKKPMPTGFRPLKQIYLLIAIVSVVAISLQIRALVRAIRGVGKPRRKTMIVLFDLAVPIVLLVLLPRVAKMPYRALWESAPDIVVATLVLIALSVMTGIVSLNAGRLSRAALPRIVSPV